MKNLVCSGYHGLVLGWDVLTAGCKKVNGSKYHWRAEPGTVPSPH